jgi:hypothetical protein
MLLSAITAQQQAVRLTPDGHPEKPVRLNNLGTSFQSQFEHLGGIANLNEAITVEQRWPISPQMATMTSLYTSIPSEPPSVLALAIILMSLLLKPSPHTHGL